MPSRENMYLLPGDGQLNITVPEFKITQCQVEELVSEIKENLRLSATPRKIKHTLSSRKSSRNSPYRVPMRCECEVKSTATCLVCMRKRRSLRCGFQEEEETDPYEVLQQLLRDGNLIQEAVRRVQRGLTPKQRYFYSDSEDDTCSPVQVQRYYDNTCVPESASARC